MMMRENGSSSRLTAVFVVLIVLLVCVGSLVLAQFVYNQLQQRTAMPTPSSVGGGALSQEGLLITAVRPDSPAAVAGLRRGDIILQADGVAMTSPQMLQQLLLPAEPGESFSLTILRGEYSATVAVTGDETGQLGLEVLAAAPFVSDDGPPATVTLFVTGTPMPQTTMPVVRAVVAGSPAALAGLQVGDVVTAVDGRALLNRDEFIAYLGQSQPGSPLSLTLRRGAETLSLFATLATHPDDSARAYLGIELEGVP